MRPTDYAADYRQRLKEQGVVFLPADHPYRLRYGCQTTADAHIVAATLAALDDETDTEDTDDDPS